jgi:hypothetical protein
MNIFSPFIVLWNMPSIWTLLTTPPLRTITPPYPVIITEPGFLILVRCPEGRRIAMVQGLVMSRSVLFLALTLFKGAPALVLSSVALKLLLLTVSAESLFLTSPPRDEDDMSPVTFSL